MLNPTGLWQALEEIPGLSAVREEWRRWLGEGHSWVEQRLLRPTGELAAVYPSRHGEPYQVIDHGGGRYRAVHPDGEPPLDLSKTDITILRLDMVKLARVLCEAFGFKAEVLDQTAAIGRYLIATWSATPRTTCPVWFCAQADRAQLHDSLRRLTAEADGPFVVFTPQAIGDAALTRTLTDRSACHLPLSEAVETVASGALAVSPAGARILEEFQGSVQALEATTAGDGRDRAVSSTPADDRYEWARQIDLVRATNQVLGEGMLNKGVLSRACADGHVKTNGKSGRSARVSVRSFLAWVSHQNQLGADEATQIRNAVIGEISSRNS